MACSARCRSWRGCRTARRTRRLVAELAELKNLTHRLSDSYLDMDLLDEQVRDVLGYVRADEIIIR